MQRVGLYEAKANLSKLVEQVSKTGEPVTITKRGEPAVDLVPHKDPSEEDRRRRQRKVLADIAEFHRTHDIPEVGIDQILADIAEGRE